MIISQNWSLPSAFSWFGQEADVQASKHNKECVLSFLVVSSSLQPCGQYWSELPFPPPGSLPNPGIEAISPVSPALQADSLPLSYRGSPLELQWRGSNTKFRKDVPSSNLVVETWADVFAAELLQAAQRKATNLLSIPPRQCLNSLSVPDITALGALWAKRQVGPESRIIRHREGSW